MTDQERFRLLVEAVKDYAIFILQPDGTVASWNTGAERMSGYSESEIVGRPLSIFYTPEDAAAGQPERELERARTEGRSVAEGWRVRKDGTRFWANSALTALRTDDGSVCGFVRLSRDDTEKRRAQEERERLLEAMEGQRRLFEMVLDHAPAAIAIFDAANLRVKWANLTFRQRLEEPWTGTDVIGMRLQKFLPEDRQEDVAALFRRVAATRRPHFDPEFELPRPGGDAVYVRFSLLPLGTEDLMVLLTDVSDSVLARKQMERANRLKSEFLASMSHELRTPLHTVIGFADLLAKGELNPKQHRQVERIQQGAKHLLSLINDILDLSKIEAGRMELHPENFLAGAALAEVMATIAPLAGAKRLSLSNRVAPDLVVRADRVRFQQILYNLLSNAVKFTRPGGSVWLESEVDAEFAAISVSDTGVGITPEDQKAIFDEFRQVGVTTKGVREGTGLGLAITQRLLHMHGGTIHVSSEPGKGSRFTFRLPLHASGKENHAPQAAAPVAAGVAAPSGRTILIADDSPAGREWLRDVFEPEFRVVEAVDGRDALECIQRERPDVVLMDIQMPEMDGYEAVRQLRADARFARLPVIALTAFAMQGDRERALEAGFDGYISKPVESDALRAALRPYVR